VPHITVEPLRKFDPLTVSVKPVDPATAEVGLSELILGALTVNVLAEETAVLAFLTVTLTAPAVSIWVLVTAAVMDVALT